MLNKKIWFLVLMISIFSYQGLEVLAQGKKQQQNEKKHAIKYSLLFFINPDGTPCRMQDQIINEIRNKLEQRVKIVYVKTTVGSDREMFYQYGIRALPTLIVVDGLGKEVKRFPPGIQNKEILIKEIGGLK